MLEVHIPSVGPEAEGPRQSPEKGHMVSRTTSWKGAQASADFLRVQSNRTYRSRSGCLNAVSGYPDLRGSDCLDLSAPGWWLALLGYRIEQRGGSASFFS